MPSGRPKTWEETRADMQEAVEEVNRALALLVDARNREAKDTAQEYEAADRRAEQLAKDLNAYGCMDCDAPIFGPKTRAELWRHLRADGHVVMADPKAVAAWDAGLCPACAEKGKSHG